MTDAADRTLRLLEETGALRKGHFVLSSGLHSEFYCQCARLFERPEMAAEAADLMKKSLGDTGATVVCAPALGGILWGYELARSLGLRTLFAERDASRQFAFRRGFHLDQSDRVLLAEDVVTTGKSVLELVPLVEAAGATVVGIASIVDRSKGAFRPGVPFHALTPLDFPTYDPADCPLCEAGVPIEQPGSRPGLTTT